MTVKELKAALDLCNDDAEVCEYVDGDDGTAQMVPIVYVYETKTGEIILENSN